MSEVINPQIPFQPEMTPAMDRANRLISLRSHPGFLDIVRISQGIVNDAVQTCIQFGGWDPLQVMTLKVRMQVAQEHHNLLLSKINDAIQAGTQELAESLHKFPEKTAQETLDQGDFVRQRVLEKFDDMDNRPAGSY